jgi:hypothetical protein
MILNESPVSPGNGISGGKYIMPGNRKTIELSEDI